MRATGDFENRLCCHGPALDYPLGMSGHPHELKEFLVRTPFFGGLEDSALDRVIGMLVLRDFPVGASVFRMGDQGRSMYIVQSGALVACANGDSGRVVRLMRFHTGDFFGETTLIEMQPRPFTALVEKAATLYELTNMDLYRLYQQDVNAYVMVLQNINRELCRRLRGAAVRLTKIADSAGDDATQIGSRGLRLG
jgi:CRP/FNR family transcriptional regulator, cyclic AMP receptor protein